MMEPVMAAGDGGIGKKHRLRERFVWQQGMQRVQAAFHAPSQVRR
jgi:hypothetical protein